MFLVKTTGQADNKPSENRSFLGGNRLFFVVGAGCEWFASSLSTHGGSNVSISPPRNFRSVSQKINLLSALPSFVTAALLFDIFLIFVIFLKFPVDFPDRERTLSVLPEWEAVGLP